MTLKQTKSLLAVVCFVLASSDQVDFVYEESLLLLVIVHERILKGSLSKCSLKFIFS